MPPSPWTTPPTIWPSTIIGLMARPMSQADEIALDGDLPRLDVDGNLGHMHGEDAGAARHRADIGGRRQPLVIGNHRLGWAAEQFRIAWRQHPRDGAERHAPAPALR